MRLYAYCLCEDEPAALEAVAGLNGAKPRTIYSGGIAAVVSDYEDESAPLTRDNVFAHERVVGHVLAHTTPLPFRFGTLTSEAQLDDYIGEQRESLTAMFVRVRGCVEMSVKIIWDVDSIKSEIADSIGETPASLKASSDAEGRGTSFLTMKRREILGGEALESRAGEVAAWIRDSLGDTVEQDAVRLQPGERLFFAAAHLVKRARLDGYRERLARARVQREGLHFLTSGPWPPYSFTHLRA